MPSCFALPNPGLGTKRRSGQAAAVCLCLLSVLAHAGCLGAFDPSSQTACATSEDCVAGWRCDTLARRCVPASSPAGEDPGDVHASDDASDALAAELPNNSGDADTLAPQDTPEAPPDAVEAGETLDDAGGHIVQDALTDAAEDTLHDATGDTSPPCEAACEVAGQVLCAGADELRVCEPSGDCLALGAALPCGFAVTCASCDQTRCAPTNACALGGACVALGTSASEGCAHCQPGGMVQNDPDGDACDDGLPCTVTRCQDGLCAVEGQVDCDDDNACTQDSCDALTGCQHAPTDGAPCDLDGSACTPDTCDGQLCSAAPTVTCDDADANPCTVEVCQPNTGKCDGAPQLLESGACDDGEDCTVFDSCVAGVCKGTPKASCCHTVADCPAAAPCAGAACIEGDCVYSQLGDGQACSPGGCWSLGSCQAGACVGATPLVCPGPGPCLEAATCNQSSGLCEAKVKDAGTPCSDGLSCTVDEVCDGGGKCGGGALVPGTCRIGGSCWADGALDPAQPCRRCDAAASGVAWTALVDGVGCDDGNPCSSGDTCAGGVCAGSGWANDGTPCADDGSVCSTDLCASGVCVHAASSGGLVCRPARSVCDPPESCDGLSPACPADVTLADSVACAPDDVCSLADACLGGECAGCVIFEDDFEDGTLSPWALKGALASVVNDATYGRVLNKYLGVEVSGDIVWAPLARPTDDFDLWAYIRRTADNGSLSLALTDNAGAGFVMRIRSSGLFSVQVDAAFEPENILADETFVPTNKQWYTFHFRKTGEQLQADLYTGRVSYTAPGSPTLSVTCPTPIGGSPITFQRVVLQGGVTLQLDDVLVTGSGATCLAPAGGGCPAP